MFLKKIDIRMTLNHPSLITINKSQMASIRIVTKPNKIKRLRKECDDCGKTLLLVRELCSNLCKSCYDDKHEGDNPIQVCYCGNCNHLVPVVDCIKCSGCLKVVGYCCDILCFGTSSENGTSEPFCNQCNGN